MHPVTTLHSQPPNTGAYPTLVAGYLIPRAASSITFSSALQSEALPAWGRPFLQEQPPVLPFSPSVAPGITAELELAAALCAGDEPRDEQPLRA